ALGGSARHALRHRGTLHGIPRHFDVAQGRTSAAGQDDDEEQNQPRTRGNNDDAGGRETSRDGHSWKQDPGPPHAGRGTAEDVLTPWGALHFSSSWPPRADRRSRWPSP